MLQSMGSKSVGDDWVPELMNREQIHSSKNVKNKAIKPGLLIWRLFHYIERKKKDLKDYFKKHKVTQWWFTATHLSQQLKNKSEKFKYEDDILEKRDHIHLLEGMQMAANWQDIWWYLREKNRDSACASGFQSGISRNEPDCHFRRQKRCGFNTWVGRITWRRA